MSQRQHILGPLPAHALYLTFQLRPGADARAALQHLSKRAIGDEVVGLGPSLVSASGLAVSGLREHPSYARFGITIPSTPAALWLWLRGGDPGQLLHRAREWERHLSKDYALAMQTPAFTYEEGRDLTGYVDGTENPEGDKAEATAIATGGSLEGSSFVAVQTWEHDLAYFDTFSDKQKDDTFGRRLADNEEFDEAPETAHVKRTAQESYEPEAFVVRRSMPWSAETGKNGLVFVAFGKSFDAYEALLSRMTGGEDQKVDNLFQFTRPVTGNFYWCPPLVDSHLKLD